MKGKRNFPKRLFATVLSAVMAFTTVPVIGMETAQAAVNTLTGVSETHWARNSIEKMVNQNILSGDSDGNLHPDRPVTRAEYIAMINRAFGYNSYMGVTLPFKDIEGTEWYADHVRIAYQQGYFAGVDKNTAGVTQPVTREEAAAMICRNLKISSTTPYVDAFADGKEISQWSKPAVGAAVEKGFIHGYTDSSFRPKALISRAEAATMFSNAMGTIYDRGGTFGQGMIEGNVTISSSRVNLQDTVITGDLYITKGVGTGSVNLKNVTVLGEVIVCGGGEGNFGGNSVTLDDCMIWKLTVDGNPERPVSLYAKGTTNIPETNIKSLTYLQNHPDTEVGFDNIEVKGPDETTLYLSGTFQNVAVMQPKNKVVLGKGTVVNMTVDEDAADAEITLDRNVVVENMNLDGNATVTGRGDIENLIVTTNETSVESLPDQIEIRPGVTADIAGKEMTSLDAAESSSAPKIVAGYPRAEEITSSAAKVYFETNKPGTIRWALTYDDAEELDEDEILKPTTITRIQKYGTLNVGESEKEVMMSLSGLEANATYILYAVLVDERDDVSRIKEEEIETADKTQPGFVSGYPRTVPQTSNSFEIEAMLTKDGTIYWAVFKKGAAAPTAYQLRSQKLDGDICHGMKKNAERNIEYGAPDLMVLHNDLHEKESYDVYVMASDGERDSKIVKLSAQTKDTTPPQWNPEPLPDKNEEKAVNVLVGADEAATVYYVVIPWGETFPKPLPSTDGTPSKQPALDSEEARKQVVSANNVFKSGKANLKENTDTFVKISGLEKETPYHVFMVLQDKAGNYSTEVKKVDVKTRDVNPPVGKVDFENSIDGKADVEEDIMIVFNEIVCYETAGAYLNLQNLQALADQKIFLFKLFDISGNEEEVVKIDYTKIRFEEGEKGATIAVFPPEAFINTDDGVGLNSGAAYKFVLNHIVDTTGNEIPKDYTLDFFRTAPPLVVLTQTNTPTDPEYSVVDYAFNMQPEARNTADRVLFDMMFTNTSDKDITFILYEWDKTMEKPQGAPDGITKAGYWKPLNAELNGGRGTKVLAKEAVTLHMIQDIEMNPLKRFVFEKFNELPYKPDEIREYAVRITSINDDVNREGWEATILMDLKCVAGEYDNMQVLATDPIREYKGALNSGKVSMVNYSAQDLKDPTKFILQMPFRDTLIPKFVQKVDANGKPTDEFYPKLDGTLTGENTQIGDVFIYPQLKTDRKATMYYIIAEQGSISGFDWLDGKAPTKDENGNFKTFGEPEQSSLNNIVTPMLLYSDMNDINGFWGTYDIKSGYSLHQPKLPADADLKPNTRYEMFCILKGAPKDPSDVYYVPFVTTDIAPPELSVVVSGRTTTGATLDITSSKHAQIYWIVMNRQDALNKGYITKDNVVVQSPQLKTLILNGSQGVNKENYVTYGGGLTKELDIPPVSGNGFYLDPFDVDLQKYSAKERFILLAYGQLRLSDDKPISNDSKYDSKIVVSEPFERKDSNPPEIAKVITNLDPGTQPKVDANGEIIGYSGGLEVYFSEPVFYLGEDDESTTLPVQKPADGKEDEFMQLLVGRKNKAPIKYHEATEGKTSSSDKDGNTIKAVEKVVFRFTKINDGQTITFNSSLCDGEGNEMPWYYLEFVAMHEEDENGELINGQDSYWEIHTINRT